MIRAGQYTDTDLAAHYSEAIGADPLLRGLLPTGTKAVPRGIDYSDTITYATNGAPAVRQATATVDIPVRGRLKGGDTKAAALLASIVPPWLAGSSDPITVDSIDRDTSGDSEDRAATTTITISATWAELRSA